jgi:hypothetical protein
MYLFFLSNIHKPSAEINADLKATSFWCKFIPPHPTHPRFSDQKTLKIITAPILDDIEIPTYPKMTNGTVFPPTWLSIARQDPGPETDAAWAVFEKVLTHAITSDQVRALGKDPSTVAKFEDEYWGLGDDAYMAQMDVFHQIHCINVLRSAAFEDHPQTTKKKEKKDKMYWIHMHHCVDIALQNIQCHASTDLLTLSWMDSRSKPWPDFSVWHQCRDIDTLVRWQRENAVDPVKFDRMPVPEGAYRLRAPWLEYAEGEERWPEGWSGPLHEDHLDEYYRPRPENHRGQQMHGAFEDFDGDEEMGEDGFGANVGDHWEHHH